MSLRPWTGDRAQYLATTARLVAESEPRVRAFTHLDLDAAAGEPVPDGAPLAGLPIAVKEIIDVAGWPVTLGSTTMTDRIATADAEPVRRLRAAGAVVAGMTTTTPFACGTTTVTTHPVDARHTPGGSSAGSGAAVGAGFVPVALASQSQASTLRPASYCGAWGYKPTHDRLPRAGMHQLSSTLDDLGIIAASLADLRAVCEVLWEPRSLPVAPPPATLRVGWLRLDDGDLPRATTRTAFSRWLAALDAAPTVSVLTGTPELAAADAAIQGSGRACFNIFATESAPVLAPLVAAGEPDPRLAEMVDHAAWTGPEGLAAALQVRDELRRTWSALAEQVDVVVTLATTNPAPVGHESTGCRRMPATSSLLGIPALSAPWLEVEGLPQGVQLLGFDGRDEELFDAAALLERAVFTRNEESS